MEDKIVDLKTAKLAKNRGFNWQVINFYNSRGYCTYANGYQTERLEASDWNNGMGSYPTLPEEVVCSAPSQSILQKWLRELATPIIVTPTTDFVAWQVEIQHPDLGLLIIDKNSEDKWFNSYEEAMEYGLSEALIL